MNIINSFRKIFRNIDLKNKIISIIIVTVFVPMIIVTTVLSNQIKNIMIKQATEASESAVNQISENINSMIVNRAVNISEILVSDPDLYKLITEPYTGGKVQKYIDTNNLKDKVNAGYGRIFQSIGVAAVYGVNGVLYNLTQPNYEDEEIINEVKKIKEIAQNYGTNTYWNGLYDNIFTNYRTNNPRIDNVIVAAMNIFNPKSGDYLGVQLFTFSENEIYARYEDTDIARNGKIFVLNIKGELLSSNDIDYVQGKKQLGKNYIEEVLKRPNSTFETQNEKVVTNYLSNLNLWSVVGELPKSYITHNINRIFSLFFVIECGFFAICLIGFIGLFLHIINPIKNLTKSMEKFISGEMSSYVEYSGADELELLEVCYNKLIDRINHQIVYEYELDKQKQQFHYDLLISQINSHFLSNSLESIVWEAHSMGADNVAKMAVELGKLFRLSCQNTDMFVEVGDEIKHIKSYVAVQKLRYGDALNFSLIVSGDIQKLKTLKILLQPLVENSIIHAFGEFNKVLNIEAKIYIENDSLIFEVIDDGNGMSEEQLESVRQKILSEEEPNKGIGLRNVRKRIKLYFESEHLQSDLILESQLGKGTKVKLILPILK